MKARLITDRQSCALMCHKIFRHVSHGPVSVVDANAVARAHCTKQFKGSVELGVSVRSRLSRGQHPQRVAGMLRSQHSRDSLEWVQQLGQQVS